jgi:hypothetical protein
MKSSLDIAEREGFRCLQQFFFPLSFASRQKKYPAFTKLFSQKSGEATMHGGRWATSPRLNFFGGLTRFYQTIHAAGMKEKAK